MANEFEEFLARIPNPFQLENLGDTKAKVQFEITGEDGGQWIADIADNVCKIDQDNADLQDRALADNVKVFLPVVDDMERALNHQPDELTVSQWVEGLQLILQKLLKLLEAKGVRPIAIQPGDDFDPMEQEAVSYEDNPDYTDNQIIESVETGYKIKDKIIRPAKVRVAK